MSESARVIFHPPRRLRWLAATALLAVVLGLFVGGTQPVAVGLFRPPWDLLAHLGLFTVVGAISGLVSGTRGWRLLLFCSMGALAIGAIDEGLQMRLPGRSADWNDLAADAVGGWLGAIFLGLAYRWADAGPWAERWRALLHKILRVPNEATDAELLRQLSRPTRPTVLAFVNAHAMNSAVHDAEFFEALMSIDTLLRDGSGMSTLFKTLSMAPGQNLNGTDFIPRLIHQFKGRAIALVGTQEPYLTRAVGAIQHKLAQGTGTAKANGFMPPSYYLALVRAHQSELIVLGMGMPKQEEVACALRAELTHPCLIVCGGAIIDFLGERMPRAPVWMRRLGLEWVYRLAHEPVRLFRRYVVGNPLFLLRTLRLKLAQQR